jgi:hypothetical protein
MLFLRRQLLRTLSFAFGSSFILSRNQLGIAAQTATQPKVSPPPAGATVRDGIAGGTEMEKVTGIGGFFFRAQDPKALERWYQQHLGISLTPSSYEDSVWQQEAGPTGQPGNATVACGWWGVNPWDRRESWQAVGDGRIQSRWSANRKQWRESGLLELLPHSP